MSLVVLVVVLFLTGLLTDMPKAVLAAIVFLIGIGLIDIKGLRRILAARPQRVRHRRSSPPSSSSRSVSSRASSWRSCSRSSRSSGARTGPKDFLVGVDAEGDPTYVSARARARRACPGCSCSASTPSCSTPTPAGSPTTSRRSSTAAPTRCGGSCSTARRSTTSTTRPASPSAGLIDSLHADGGVFALAEADPELLATLTKYGTLTDFDNTHIYSTVPAAVAAFRSAPAATTSKTV